MRADAFQGFAVLVLPYEVAERHMASPQHCDAEGDVLNGKPDSSPGCGLPNCASMDTDSGGKLWSRRVWCLWARLSA